MPSHPLSEFPVTFLGVSMDISGNTYAQKKNHNATIINSPGPDNEFDLPQTDNKKNNKNNNWNVSAFLSNSTLNDTSLS